MTEGDPYQLASDACAARIQSAGRRAGRVSGEPGARSRRRVEGIAVAGDGSDVRRP
jgi:hypothetical protein